MEWDTILVTTALDQSQVYVLACHHVFLFFFGGEGVMINVVLSGKDITFDK